MRIFAFGFVGDDVDADDSLTTLFGAKGVCAGNEYVGFANENPDLLAGGLDWPCGGSDNVFGNVLWGRDDKNGD